jgi:hypothetical protein
LPTIFEGDLAMIRLEIALVPYYDERYIVGSLEKRMRIVFCLVVMERAD